MRRTIGERLKSARLAAKLTQQDVALDFLLSRQAISAWEGGKTMPTILEFRELVTLYGLSADAILFGVDDVTVLSQSLLAQAVASKPEFEPSQLPD